MPSRTLPIGAITTKTLLRDDNVLRLSDGRQLGYAEYGDRDGEPVILVHGNPGSRLFWGSIPGSPFLPGLRIIAPDRPGYGLSDFLTKDTLTNWPSDVEELADSLGLDQFTLVGASAGGPYALACAWKNPERLKSVGIVSSVGPIDAPGATEGMNSNRLLFFLAPRWPWLMRLQMDLIGFTAVCNPESLLWYIQSKVPEVDRAVLARPEIRATLAQDWTEAFRQGGRASAYDCTVPVQWPIPLDEIKMKVHLWHGEVDRSVGGMGLALAEGLPDCQATFIPDAGHFWLFDHMDEVLDTLLAGVGRSSGAHPVSHTPSQESQGDGNNADGP